MSEELELRRFGRRGRVPPIGLACLLLGATIGACASTEPITVTSDVAFATADECEIATSALKVVFHRGTILPTSADIRWDRCPWAANRSIADGMRKPSVFHTLSLAKPVIDSYGDQARIVIETNIARTTCDFEVCELSREKSGWQVRACRPTEGAVIC